MFKAINKSKWVWIKKGCKKSNFQSPLCRLSVAAPSLNLLTTEYSGEQKEGCTEKSLQRNLLICRHENLLSLTARLSRVGSSPTLVNLRPIIDGAEPKFDRSYSSFGSSVESHLDVSFVFRLVFPPALQNSQQGSSVTLWKQTSPPTHCNRTTL